MANQKTTYGGQWAANPLYWWAHSPIRIEECNGHLFFAQDRSSGSFMRFEDLPIEFFSHQIIEIPPLSLCPDDEISNADELLSFCEKWGLPFSPYRDYGTRRKYGESLQSINEWEQGIQITDSFFPGFSQSLTNEGLFVSVSEAARSIKDLSLFASNISRIANGADSSFGMGDIYNAAYPRSTAYWCSAAGGAASTKAPGSVFDFGDARTGGLTAAVCRQMIETLSDPAPWRECACKGCGKMFKRKQGARNPHRDSSYCCKKCEERQRKRNQREAARNRIDHGI